MLRSLAWVFLIACSRTGLDVDEVAAPADGGVHLDARATGDGAIDGGSVTPLSRGRIAASRWSLFGNPQGNSHTCVITASGGVKCWGANDVGQLGNGGGDANGIPVDVVGLTDVTQVTAEQSHTCALRKDGTVWCWGEGLTGELGNGVEANESTPVQAEGVANAVAVHAGGGFTCALLQGGTVSCWGGWANGCDNPKPIDLGLADVTSLDANENQACALRADGTVFCWGRSAKGQFGTSPAAESCTPVVAETGLAGVAFVATFFEGGCVAPASGPLACWGDNEDGVFGNGDTSDAIQATPVPSLASDLVDVSGGVAFACGVTSKGAVECWGLNWAGQLGDGTLDASTTPVVTIASGAVAVAAGAIHACALMADDSVLCWGNNLNGQLGVGSPPPFTQTSPVEPVGL